ncbi:hypothetical protein VT03_28045 [Planctomyces sp. SH-PL14]|nr:hypothetical protein VT03_28045 [Planctomyces sp. SH-PL14]
MADGSPLGPHRRVLRLLQSEYQLLLELAVAPVRSDDCTPSVLEAAEFLVSLGLAMRRDRLVHISERGQTLVANGPVSQTAYTVAFDACWDGW